MSRIYVPCRVCDGDDPDFLFEKRGWKIVRCRSCGFVYTNPIPSKENLRTVYCAGSNPTLEDLQRYYSSSRINKKWDKEKNVHLTEHSAAKAAKRHFAQLKTARNPIGRIWVRRLRLIRWNRYLPQEGRFLDVGCGQGHLVMAAKRTGKWDCAGVDVQIHKLRCARSLDPDTTIFLGAVNELGLRDETFDIVTMTHLLEHTFDPLSALREASRILRSNGVLVVTVPNVAHAFARIRGKKWRAVHPPVHLWYFSPETLERLVERVGMKTIHKEVLVFRASFTVLASKRGSK